MGLAASAENNDDLIDHMISMNTIISRYVERYFRMVDRALFMDSNQDAYNDRPYKSAKFPDGGVIHLSANTIYASVLENLRLYRGASFLNVGSGTGFFSTMVGFFIGNSGVNHGIELYGSVVDFARERVHEFRSQRQVSTHDWTPPQFVTGNAFTLQDTGPRYDRIYIGAAIREGDLLIFLNVLNMEGILVAPVMTDDTSCSLMQYKRTPLGMDKEVISQVNFSELIVLDPEDPIRGADVNEALQSIFTPHSLRDICVDFIRARIRKRLKEQQPPVMRAIVGPVRKPPPTGERRYASTMSRQIVQFSPRGARDQEEEREDPRRPTERPPRRRRPPAPPSPPFLPNIPLPLTPAPAVDIEGPPTLNAPTRRDGRERQIIVPMIVNAEGIARQIRDRVIRIRNTGQRRADGRQEWERERAGVWGILHDEMGFSNVREPTAANVSTTATNEPAVGRRSSEEERDLGNLMLMGSSSSDDEMTIAFVPAPEPNPEPRIRNTIRREEADRIRRRRAEVLERAIAERHEQRDRQQLVVQHRNRHTDAGRTAENSQLEVLKLLDEQEEFANAVERQNADDESILAMLRVRMADLKRRLDEADGDERRVNMILCQLQDMQQHEEQLGQMATERESLMAQKREALDQRLREIRTQDRKDMDKARTDNMPMARVPISGVVRLYTQMISRLAEEREKREDERIQAERYEEIRKKRDEALREQREQTDDASFFDQLARKLKRAVDEREEMIKKAEERDKSEQREETPPPAARDRNRMTRWTDDEEDDSIPTPEALKAKRRKRFAKDKDEKLTKPEKLSEAAERVLNTMNIADAEVTDEDANEKNWSDRERANHSWMLRLAAITEEMYDQLMNLARPDLATFFDRDEEQADEVMDTTNGPLSIEDFMRNQMREQRRTMVSHLRQRYLDLAREQTCEEETEFFLDPCDCPHCKDSDEKKKDKDSNGTAASRRREHTDTCQCVGCGAAAPAVVEHDDDMNQFIRNFNEHEEFPRYPRDHFLRRIRATNLYRHRYQVDRQRREKAKEQEEEQKKNMEEREIMEDATPEFIPHARLRHFPIHRGMQIASQRNFDRHFVSTVYSLPVPFGIRRILAYGREQPSNLRPTWMDEAFVKKTEEDDDEDLNQPCCSKSLK